MLARIIYQFSFCSSAVSRFTPSYAPHFKKVMSFL